MFQGERNKAYGRRQSREFNKGKLQSIFVPLAFNKNAIMPRFQVSNYGELSRSYFNSKQALRRKKAEDICIISTDKFHLITRSRCVPFSPGDDSP